MTTAAAVREAWREAVWSNDAVLELTPRIHLHDVLTESEFDFEKLCHDGVVNFFLCKVQRRSEPLIGRRTQYTFQVRVEYYLQQTDVAESTYNAVEDRLGGVDELVISELTGDWSETVDFYTGSSPLAIKPTTVGGRQCWQGGLVYTAFKTA